MVSEQLSELKLRCILVVYLGGKGNFMCFKTLTHGGHIYPTTLGTLAYPSLQEMTLGEVVGGPQSCPTFDLFMELQIGNGTNCPLCHHFRLSCMHALMLYTNDPIRTEPNTLIYTML